MAVRTRTTAAEFYNLPEYEEHDLIQLIDGEVIITVPPVPRHQDIVLSTAFVFKLHAKVHGGKAYVAPVQLYLDEYNIYEPDVLYLSPDSRCVVEEKRLVGPPDLVVEVLSPGTAKHDRQKKYLSYERHGVREYWIMDPIHIYLEVWVLRNDAFVKLGTYGPGDAFESTVLSGTTIEVSQLFED